MGLGSYLWLFVTEEHIFSQAKLVIQWMLEEGLCWTMEFTPCAESAELYPHYFFLVRLVYMVRSGGKNSQWRPNQKDCQSCISRLGYYHSNEGCPLLNSPFNLLSLLHHLRTQMQFGSHNCYKSEKKNTAYEDVQPRWELILKFWFYFILCFKTV